MTNSDSAYGVHNKATRIYKIYYADDDSVISQNFSGNLTTAKTFFFTDDALACWDNHSTQISWAITDDGNGIKVTNAFGTKGPANQDPAQDWAALWTAQKNSLVSANNWIKQYAVSGEYNKDIVAGRDLKWMMTTSTDHLF